MSYKIYDRVILQSNFNLPTEEIIKAGTVCTIVTEPTNKEDDILILRFGYDDQNKPKAFGVASSLVRKARKDELLEASYKDIVSRNFWIGEKFAVGNDTSFDNIVSGDIGIIEKMFFYINEQDDMITFLFGDEEYDFQRSFVETYFNKYDEEVEQMMGEEIVMKDMPRNYYLPGARMIYKNQIVILNKKKKDDVFKVTLMNHQKIKVHKDELQPILDIESFLPYEESEIIPENYRVGRLLSATSDIEKHVLLKDKIKSNDMIEILYVNGKNINAFEDQYKIALNSEFDKPFDISYNDLNKFFIPFTWEEALTPDHEDDEFDFEQFTRESSKALRLEQEPSSKIIEEQVDLKIHDVTILGFRFKIDEGGYESFSIDEQHKHYNFNQIDSMIQALKTLQDISKNKL